MLSWTLEQARNYLQNDASPLEREAIVHHARIHYVAALDVSGAVSEYMEESLFASLNYHATVFDTVGDMILDDLEIANTPSIEQGRAILAWIWEKSYQHNGLEPGEDLDSLINDAAVDLERAVMRSFIVYCNDNAEDYA